MPALVTTEPVSRSIPQIGTERPSNSPAATSSGAVIPQRAGYEAPTGSGRVTGADADG